ncbi:MAG: copper ion binding protein [Candidatus Diapherotrites archaeon]|nr:copper ion binding protein [Candidatus Diapherotrites archaeon]
MENEINENEGLENERNQSMEEIIDVQGIDCKVCVQIIEEKISSLKGVEKASASMVEGKVFVAFDPKQVSLEKIKAEIRKAGYKADSMPDSEETLESTGQDSEAADSKTESIYDSRFEKTTLAVSNMVCESCEKIIEKSLHKLDGIKKAEASYSKGNVKIAYNPEKISLDEIIRKIGEAGYSASTGGKGQGIQKKYILISVAALIILIGGYLAASSTLGSLNISIPTLDTNTSIILIFVVGLLTGFHCIGMCGSFVLSYTAKARRENPKSLNIALHGQYALGKMLSYTVIGGIFGLIGSIFVFTPELRAVIALLAGIFLIIFGLKLLNIFPILRKFSLPQGMFDKLKVGPLKSKNNSPLVVGLLNGLFIACGPLQAMYVLAASTGNLVNGAMLLFAFGIGTLIPMMGFGVFASFISHGLQNKIVRISAVIVIVMGLLMINNGLALTGNAVNASTIGGIFSSQQPQITDGNGPGGPVNSPYQIINMDVTGAGWVPNSFVLKRGVPVKWIINGKELNGCNSGIRVPAYNLSFSIKQGLQTIEFTPDKTGVIQWSCWMGMIQGTFVVRDDVGVDSAGKITLDSKVQLAAAAQVAATPKPAGGCGCGGGGSAGSCGG